jgi:hypothetical protein
VQQARDYIRARGDSIVSEEEDFCGRQSTLLRSDVSAGGDKRRDLLVHVPIDSRLVQIEGQTDIANAKNLDEVFKVLVGSVEDSTAASRGLPVGVDDREKDARREDGVGALRETSEEGRQPDIEMIDEDAIGQTYRNKSDRWIQFPNAPESMQIVLSIPPQWYVGCPFSDIATGGELVLRSTINQADPGSMHVRIHSKLAPPGAEEVLLQQARGTMRAEGHSFVSEEENFTNHGTTLLRFNVVVEENNRRDLIVYLHVGPRLLQIEGQADVANAEKLEEVFETLVGSIQSRRPPVSKPTTSGAVRVKVTRAGNVYWNRQMVDLEEFATRLKDVRRTSGSIIYYPEGHGADPTPQQHAVYQRIRDTQVSVQHGWDAAPEWGRLIWFEIDECPMKYRLYAVDGEPVLCIDSFAGVNYIVPPGSGPKHIELLMEGLAFLISSHRVIETEPRNPQRAFRPDLDPAKERCVELRVGFDSGTWWTSYYEPDEVPPNIQAFYEECPAFAGKVLGAGEGERTESLKRILELLE